MLNHASELGINSNQIAIGGESAGGGLPAALTYIQHLQDANVEANCNVYKGMYHAFDMMEPENPTSLQAIEDFNKFFEYAKKQYFASNNGY